MPRKISFLEPAVCQVAKTFNKCDFSLLFTFQPPADAVAGDRLTATHPDEDASSASPGPNDGLNLLSKAQDDKNDSGLGNEKNAPLSPNDMFAKENM